MGNNFSKQKTAANQNVSSVGAENAIKQYDFVYGLENTETTTDLEKKKNLLKNSIRLAESSIRVDNEFTEELTKKLNNRKALSEILKNKLIDLKKELDTLLEEEKTIISYSSGGTRKKILNKNNRKKRTSYKK